MATRSKAWVCGRSLSGTAGWNPLSFVSVCVSSGRVIGVGADQSSRGIERDMSECDCEVSIMRRLWPTRGAAGPQKKHNIACL